MTLKLGGLLDFYTKAKLNKGNKANSVRATLIGLVGSTSSKAIPTIWLTILKRTECAQLMIATSTPSQYPSKTEAGAEALDNIGEEKAGGELPIA